MNVSVLGYQENPFCAECYDDRVAKAVEGKRFVGWKRDGEYMTPLWEDAAPPAKPDIGGGAEVLCRGCDLPYTEGLSCPEYRHMQDCEPATPVPPSQAVEQGERLMEVVKAAHYLRCGRWDEGDAQGRLSRAIRALPADIIAQLEDPDAQD